jgi:nucleoredoxin
VVLPLTLTLVNHQLINQQKRMKVSQFGKIFILLLLSLIINVIDSQDTGAKKSVAENLFGDSLYSWETQANENGVEERAVFSVPIDEVIPKEIRYIGIYFSASWCGPCRKFTPILKKFYQEMKKRKEPFEIVWVSADRTSEDFFQYYQEMEWKAIPLENTPVAYQSLGQKCDVHGIPHLAIIDARNGQIITNNGREKVLEDSYGLQFPWKPRLSFSLSSLKGGSVNSLVRRTLESLRQLLSGFFQVSLWQGVALRLKKVVSALFSSSTKGKEKKVFVNKK